MTPPPVEASRQLCHDLRHPLVTIAALVAAARIEGGDLPPAVVARLRQIEEEAQRASRLCAQVLTEDVRPELVRVDLLVTEVVDCARVGLDTDINLAAEPAIARVDPGGVRRVLWNLLENGCRAAGAGGSVRVDVREIDGEVEIVVADTGPGFGAAPAGTASLGLRIVHDVVRRHDGRVEYGRGPAGGAQVVVTLPGLDADPHAGAWEPVHHGTRGWQPTRVASR